MTLQACADLVARGDPDRFAATMAAPPDARAILFPIYAFNVEVSRAPWLTEEPMIAEMRLQWWRDVLEEIRTGGDVRRHEVATPLSEVIDATAASILDTATAARRWDARKDPFEDQTAFEAHIDATAGGLLWVAARALGAGDGLQPVIRNAGYAMGLANWFRAIPELEARGRKPLPDGRPGTVQTLAREGLARLGAARASRHALPQTARPALFAIWLAGPVLSRAAADPTRVAGGTLEPSEFRKRATLVLRAATGRW